MGLFFLRIAVNFLFNRVAIVLEIGEKSGEMKKVEMVREFGKEESQGKARGF